MKNLLVALDGSPRSRSVLDAAVQQAKSAGAKLVLFRAVGIPIDMPFTSLGLSPVEVMNVLEERARTELAELAEKFAKDVPHEVRIEAGSSWQAICQAARAIDAALIVIGSHGYGGLDRVLGTTAARVVNHADCSVLVVRSQESTAASVAKPA